MTSPRSTQAPDPLKVPWHTGEGAHAASIYCDGYEKTLLHCRSVEAAEHIVGLHNRALMAQQEELDDKEHYVMFDDNGWTVQHSMKCRNKGVEHMSQRCLFLAAIRDYAASLTGPPTGGIFRIDQTDPLLITHIGEVSGR